MKKVMKRLGMTIAALCMMLMIPVITSYAAEGTLQFSDPTGKVGEEITVKVKMEGGGLPIGDGNATLTYDPAKLEFVSGTNATAENGTISIAGSGTGAETELNFELVFKALAEGETTINVTGSTAYLFSDETLNLQPGTSTIKVEAGDAAAGETTDAAEETKDSDSEKREVGEENIEVAGTMYGIYENFTDALIPEGFSKTTITHDGEEHNAIMQDVSGQVIVYLVTGSNDPVMAVYKEDGHFVVTEMVSQTDDYYLLVLGEGDGSTLPEQFQPTTIEINGTQFPAWQNMESPDYFLMYALSSTGEEGYYQYDSIEETYQRYAVATTEPEEETAGNPIIEKVKSLVNEYFMIALAAGAALFLLMLIILIVLAVKLRNRNADLDAFYDEYDDDDSDEADDEYDDEYEDDEYDEYEDDDEYDDEYEDDEYDDEYDDDEYDEYDDEEDDEKKKKGFDIEFIDL